MRPSGTGLQLDGCDVRRVCMAENRFVLATPIECLQIVVDLVHCSNEESVKKHRYI